MKITEVSDDHEHSLRNLVEKYLEHTIASPTSFESDEEYMETGKIIFKDVIEKMFSIGLDTEECKEQWLIMKEHNKSKKLEFEKQFGITDDVPDK